MIQTLNERRNQQFNKNYKPKQGGEVMIRVFFLTTELHKGEKRQIVLYDARGEEYLVFDIGSGFIRTKQKELTFLQNALNSIEKAGHEIISVHYKTVDHLWHNEPCYEIITRTRET